MNRRIGSGRVLSGRSPAGLGRGALPQRRYRRGRAAANRAAGAAVWRMSPVVSANHVRFAPPHSDRTIFKSSILLWPAYRRRGLARGACAAVTPGQLRPGADENPMAGIITGIGAIPTFRRLVSTRRRVWGQGGESRRHPSLLPYQRLHDNAQRQNDRSARSGRGNGPGIRGRSRGRLTG